MAHEGVPIVDFFVNRELGWGTGATFFITGLIALVLIVKRSRH